MIAYLDTLTAGASIDSSNGPVVSSDMSNATYHSERGHISRSTAHRYYGAEGGRAQRYVEVYGKSLFSGNAATGFGSIVDAAIECEMRGVNWRTQIAVPPPSVLASDGSRRGKAFQEWKANLPVGGFECSEVDFLKVEDIVSSIREHRAANELLEAATHSQYSVFWTNEDGHRLKARADGVTANEWFDLKTTSSEWRDLKWSFLRFGYDWQAHWYSQAAKVSGWPDFVFKFIVVQTFAPFNVRVVTLPREIVDAAGDQIRETLDTMRHRRETNGYVDDSYHAVQELVF
jgi:hypothetical protein